MAYYAPFSLTWERTPLTLWLIISKPHAIVTCMDPEERERRIEDMVGRLREALLQPPIVNAADGMSAALIFISRLSKALILCSQDTTSRATNSGMIVESLRQLADELEAEESSQPPMILH